jgi:hypothetical protein
MRPDLLLTPGRYAPRPEISEKLRRCYGIEFSTQIGA